MSQPEPPTLPRRTFLHAAGGLAAVSAFAAACGSNTGRSGNTPAPTGSAAPAPGGGNAALTQWYHQYGEAGTQQAAQRYAQAYPDAKITMLWEPGDYQTKLSTRLLSNTPPDVFENQLNIDMVKSNQIVPLDDIIGPVKDDFDETVISTNTIDGKIYGVRMINDPQLIYYRKSLFDAAGVQPPQTFDELLDAARRLTSKKVKGMFVGNDGGSGALGRVALLAAGQDRLTPDHKVSFDSDRAIMALGKLRQLFTSGSLLLGAPTDWADPGAFNSELCAMQWIGLWAMPAIQKTWGDDFGVIPFPKIDDQGKPAIYNGGWTEFVSAKSRNIDAAKAYVKWLWIDQAQYQEDWSLNYGFHIPPRKSLATKATKLQSGPAADAVRLASENGVADDPAWTKKMDAAYLDLVNKVVRQGADARTEVAKTKAAVETELKRLFG